MGRSVKSLQREIDAREFAEWIIYARQNPFGDERADLRAAVIARQIAVGQVKHPGQLKLSDFILRFGPPEKVSAQDAKKMVKDWLAAGKVRGQKAHDKARPAKRRSNGRLRAG